MEKLLKIEDVVEMTGLSGAHLAQLRYRGSGPKFLKLTARTVRYRLGDVQTWLESTARTRTDEVA